MIVRPTVLAIDYGGTLATRHVLDPGAGRRADEEAISALHALAGDYRLLLSSNIRPGISRRLELRRAGVQHLFSMIVESDKALFKPMRDFYCALICAAGCPAQQIMHVGNRLDSDVLVPVAMGMSAAYVCPYATPGVWLPDRVIHIRRFAGLPAALTGLAREPTGHQGSPSMHSTGPDVRAAAAEVGGTG